MAKSFLLQKFFKVVEGCNVLGKPDAREIAHKFRLNKKDVRRVLRELKLNP